MPILIECPTCQRLYSQHSLPIHQRSCVKVSRMENKSQSTVRKRSKSSSKRKKGRNIGETPVERPRTRSLTRNDASSDAQRVCFVCGEQVDVNVHEKHKEQCYEEWVYQIESLSDRFHFNSPNTLNIPSVDGTVDVARENRKAIKSSRECQVVRCRGCNSRIELRHARAHQCVRHEPTIEFYF